MNRLLALIQREYWENRGALRTTPLVVGGLYLLGTLMSLATAIYFDNELFTVREALFGLSQVPEASRSQIIYNINLFGGSFLFTLVLGFVVFFYLLGALFDDRKDRSILFWKSLPASDLQTLLSKLLTAMVVAPLIFWAVYVLTQLLTGLITAGLVAYAGENPWTLLISASNPVKAWLLVLASWLSQAIWALPIYGWLLLVSAYAPRIPLLFALLPPLAFAVLQLWLDFLRTFTLQENLFGLLGRWFANSPLILTADDKDDRVEIALGIPVNAQFDHSVTLGNMLDRLISMDMLWGLLIATALLTGALWLRRRATES